MAIKIERPEGEEAVTELILFRDRVYRDRPARWPTQLPFDLPLLLGQSPMAEGREFRPLLARDGGTVVARTVATIDERYQRHWKEKLGHVVMFEALPDAREATRQLMDAACEWLRERGADAARAGFGLMDFPFVTDDYESLPPSLLRHNPAYYHSLLKDAGFETEQGFVDYKIEVRPELVARWESALEGARRGGFQITPLADVPEHRRVREFTAVWNDAFKAHWGMSPFTEADMAMLTAAFAGDGMLDTSVLAYRGDEPIGVLWVVPETTGHAAFAPGRVPSGAEKLNFLGIGVHDSARGRGVNLAMASYAFLELVRRGTPYLSYTLVLDHNWPSRRTGEKL